MQPRHCWWEMAACTSAHAPSFVQGDLTRYGVVFTTFLTMKTCGKACALLEGLWILWMGADYYPRGQLMLSHRDPHPIGLGICLDARKHVHSQTQSCFASLHEHCDCIAVGVAWFCLLCIRITHCVVTLQNQIEVEPLVIYLPWFVDHSHVSVSVRDPNVTGVPPCIFYIRSWRPVCALPLGFLAVGMWCRPWQKCLIVQ
jgi:hypothetical protein